MGTIRNSWNRNNLEMIRREYSWEKLVDEHEKYVKWMVEQKW